MKFASSLALIGLATATNPVPVSNSFPGWHDPLTNFDAQVEVQLFVDLLCPGCQGEHELLTSIYDNAFLDKTVKDYINVMVTPTVLPYHLNSFQLAQVVPYLQDKCAEDSSFCDLFEPYARMCWDNMDYLTAATDKSTDEIVEEWSEKTADLLNVSSSEIKDLYTDDDIHNSNTRVRQFFKYAMQSDISWTPSIKINSVKIYDNPGSVQEWMDMLDSLYNVNGELIQ
mmetsp:Transcript_10532/g.16111  ORF Transcript_10532/g.16111 Transcript_10532/m.16111 type:complete len:227 (-) Transcript_10532:72-752(-)